VSSYEQLNDPFVANTALNQDVIVRNCVWSNNVNGFIDSSAKCKVIKQGVYLPAPFHINVRITIDSYCLLELFLSFYLYNGGEKCLQLRTRCADNLVIWRLKT